METGLQLTPRTREDSVIMRQILNESPFYATFNSEFGFYFIEEEEENYDELEEELVELFPPSINYTIEGVF